MSELAIEEAYSMSALNQDHEEKNVGKQTCKECKHSYIADDGAPTCGGNVIDPDGYCNMWALAEDAPVDTSADYLLATEDKQVLKNLAAMGQHLKELKIKMVEAEAVFKAAEKEYTYYADSVLPMEMYNAGVSTLALLDGGVLKYDKKFYCTPNKNENDKAVLAAWLRQQGGDFLIKERAAVDKAQIARLKESGIPYTEISDFNTNSLKAFLMDKIGAKKGSIAQITIEDIPPCAHFQEMGSVTIDL